MKAEEGRGSGERGVESEQRGVDAAWRVRPGGMRGLQSKRKEEKK